MSKYTRDLSKSIPEDEPFFVIRGKDWFAPYAIAQYALLVRIAAETDGGGLESVADECDNFAAAVVAWQSENRDKVRYPD